MLWILMYFKYQNKMENILVHLPVLYLNELYLEHIVQSYNAANYTDDNYYFFYQITFSV